ncbi:hypothetical protein MP478_08815 [Chryseobacterium sp. WG14]|uniref:hypothetical protein n=1 Tax=Chryseobacterium sp. WG14 TaxID=2926909 RepID=UPI00211E9E3C|nr:hypothetical protein [Chryseobacterium sp. WG14]MCQ9639491.1 hypothetical protein [Chryseobacterium sp. WG14]
MIRYAEEFARRNQYPSIRFNAFSMNDTANAVYTKKVYDLVGTVRFRKGYLTAMKKF